MKKFILLTACIILVTSLSFAQVTISPTNLFIDNSSKFGTYMVINNSNTPQEISINFIFEYSRTDSLGERYTVRDGSLEEENSIVDGVRAFPQNFVLQPNSRQIVRLRINAPGNLNDGTYWARIKTSSTPQSPPIEIQSDNNVSARVGITIEQVTGLFYKNGSANTGIEIENIHTRVLGSDLLVLTDFKRLGNSPFLGTIETILTNNDTGETVSDFSSTTYYTDGTHKENFNLENLNPGSYTVSVNFRSERTDISSRDIVQMEPVTQTTTITIP